MQVGPQHLGGQQHAPDPARLAIPGEGQKEQRREAQRQHARADHEARRQQPGLFLDRRAQPENAVDSGNQVADRRIGRQVEILVGDEVSLLVRDGDPNRPRSGERGRRTHGRRTGQRDRGPGLATCREGTMRNT